MVESAHRSAAHLEGAGDGRRRAEISSWVRDELRLTEIDHLRDASQQARILTINDEWGRVAQWTDRSGWEDRPTETEVLETMVAHYSSAGIQTDLATFDTGITLDLSPISDAVELGRTTGGKLNEL